MRLLLSLFLLFCTIPAFAKDPIRSIEGIVTKVSGGDTVNIQDHLGTKVKVRLYGIDASETEKSNKKTKRVSKPGQPYGEEAYQALTSKIYRKRVKLEVMAVDQYKRSVGVIYLNGNINQEMVAEGWAFGNI